MAVESRQGSDIDSIAFNRIEFANPGAGFFVYLAQQSTTHPVGDVPKLVRWWRMSVVEDLGFKADDEVDELRWLMPVDAAELVSYDHDRSLITMAPKRSWWRRLSD